MPFAKRSNIAFARSSGPGEESESNLDLISFLKQTIGAIHKQKASRFIIASSSSLASVPPFGESFLYGLCLQRGDEYSTKGRKEGDHLLQTIQNDYTFTRLALSLSFFIRLGFI